MTPLDILDVFDASAGKFAFIATYEFDPVFFERRILHRKAFGGAERILVLMDQGRYQDLIDQGLSVSGFNRRYLVAPINRCPQVFHPKLYLILGDQYISGIVGSNNCTSAGIAYNMELCSTFMVRDDPSSTKNSLAVAVLRQIYRAIQAFTSDAASLVETIKNEFFQPIEEQHPWLGRNVVELPQQASVELLHSHRDPLWRQIKNRLKEETVERISILAPFYDRDIEFLRLVKAEWPNAGLSIIAQQKYATLDGRKLAELLSAGEGDQLLAVAPPAGRRLHAKAFAFETATQTFWLTGSANATIAAVNGHNTEAALWFSTEETIDAILKSDELIIESIDPSKFEFGIGEEPTNRNFPPMPEFRLASAFLREKGSLEIEFEIPDSIQELTLRIKNFNEPQPFLSLRLGKPTGGKASIELHDNQTAEIHGAAICELKGSKNGGVILSNGIALVQLNELLKQRTEGGGPANPIRKISETGEGLMPFLDSLGTIREAIEFLDHCSIRFNDGEPSGGRFGGSFWKPRDPFVGDIPEQWLAEPIDNTVKALRDAVWNFVLRHQSRKLERHILRGNLNGLPNFLDIFRTLNALLLAFHKRRSKEEMPVIPHPYVTAGIGRNLSLLIGSFDSEGTYEPGFIDSIDENFEGDREPVREWLQQERVPQMLQAAVEAMIEVRLAARNLQTWDSWSIEQLRRVSDWIDQQGLQPASPEDIKRAGLEYAAVARAA